MSLILKRIYEILSFSFCVIHAQNSVIWNIEFDTYGCLWPNNLPNWKILSHLSWVLFYWSSSIVVPSCCVFAGHEFRILHLGYFCTWSSRAWPNISMFWINEPGNHGAQITTREYIKLYSIIWRMYIKTILFFFFFYLFQLERHVTVSIVISFKILFFLLLSST